MTKRTARAAVPNARIARMMMIGMAMTLLAAIGISAWAEPAPPPAGMEPGRAGMARGVDGGMQGGMDGGMHGGMDGMHGEMHGGMHGGMHGMGGGRMFGGSPEHVAHMVDFMLDGLGASDAQRSQIKQIATQAAADLKAQAAAGRGLRQRGLQILTAPTIDAGAAEQLRQQMSQHHDQMSRRVMQAVLAVANVLTPEQRSKLGERIRDRRARMEDRMKRMQERMPRMEHEAPRR